MYESIFAGWSTRKIATAELYECPGCKRSQDSLFGDGEGLAECFKCKQKFPAHSFNRINKKRILAACAHCNAEVWFTPMNAAFLGYLCGKCQNYVAFQYGYTHLQPAQVLRLGWNSSVLKRGIPLDSSLMFVPSESKKDYLILNLLQVIAKQEDPRFTFSQPNKDYAALLINRKENKYLGFICWTEKENAVLRQFFILKDERRKGHAQMMVAFWVENYADPLHEKFCIESPNESALNLHIKMGHVRREGDGAVGIKCNFVAGL